MMRFKETIDVIIRVIIHVRLGFYYLYFMFEIARVYKILSRYVMKITVTSINVNSFHCISNLVY